MWSTMLPTGKSVYTSSLVGTWGQVFPLEPQKLGPCLSNTILVWRSRAGDTSAHRPAQSQKQEGAGITLSWLLQISSGLTSKVGVEVEKGFLFSWEKRLGVLSLSWYHQCRWRTTWLSLCLVLFTSHICEGTRRLQPAMGKVLQKTDTIFSISVSCMDQAWSTICRARLECRQVWKDGQILSLCKTQRVALWHQYLTWSMPLNTFLSGIQLSFYS